MSISSPRHSLIRFSDAAYPITLPVYGSIKLAFQFMVDEANVIGYASPLSVAVVNMSNQVIFQHATFVAENYCSWGRITGASFPMVMDAAQPLPAGTYNTLEEFLAALKAFGLNAYGSTFLQCCSAVHNNITFNYNSGQVGNITFYKGLQQVTIDRSFTLGIPVPVGTCFKLAIISAGIVLGYSNTFKRIAEDKFLTHITYSCNEDAYGFRYPDDDVFNAVYLHLYTRFPRYPETRKVYIKSNKKYKVLFSSIEKEWEVITESMPDMLHEKIAVLFSHDNIRFVNKRINSDVVKIDDYAPNWTEDNDSDTDSAVAKCKINTPFEGRNSNCERRSPCCTAVLLPDIVFPDAFIGYPYSYVIALQGTAPFALSNIVKPSWLTIAAVFNTVVFSGTPDTGEVTGVVISGTISNCSAANTANFADAINVSTAGTPMLVLMINDVLVIGFRHMIFDVGPNVHVGNRYVLTAYGHDVTVIADSTDTQGSIGIKLVAAVNATTETQWNSAGLAPVSGTPGFKPIASNGSAGPGEIVINLNFSDQFTGAAYIS